MSRMSPELTLSARDRSCPRRLAAIHGVGLAAALEFGRHLGHELPSEVVMYAVEVENDRELSEQLSPSVDDAVPVGTMRIVDELVGPDSESSSPHELHGCRAEGAEPRLGLDLKRRGTGFVVDGTLRMPRWLADRRPQKTPHA